MFGKMSLSGRKHVPYLVVKDAKGELLDKRDLVKDEYTLGRGSDCDIKIDRGIISDRHLRIVRDKNNAYTIEDLSSNGTYRGKGKINAATPLYNGDKFSLGSPRHDDRVVVIFNNPLPSWRKAALFGLYSASGVFIGLTLYGGYIWNKYDVKAKVISSGNRNSSVLIYDRGLKQTLTKIDSSQKVVNKKSSDFPEWFSSALMASEDASFYYHVGVDSKGIARALINNIQKKDEQGGSGISQQLARTLFPELRKEKKVGNEDKTESTSKDDNQNQQATQGRGIFGKIDEAIVTFKLESTYNKDEILELYLNRVPLGARNGFENAAQLFFEKSGKNLNLSEAASLIAMLQAPTDFSPCKSPGPDGLTIKQRNIVIDRLAATGIIEKVDAGTLKKSTRLPISENACKTDIQATKAPYFKSYVEKEVKRILGKKVGIAVETGIDFDMQEKAEKAFSQTINSIGTKRNFKIGAIVTIDKDTGLIKAMVGGENYVNQQRNDAVDAQRSPGSTFKLFAYTAAIESGATPMTPYSCNPLTWDGQTFSGCNHGSSGNTDLRTGFARSENTIALRVAKAVGSSKVIETARKMGITSPLLNSEPRLVLGQSNVNPLEITGAYSTIAAEGVRHQTKAILKIYDTDNCKEPENISTCVVIYDATKEPKDTESVLEPAVASTMTSLMRGVVTDGTGKNANIPGLEVVGKTGTAEAQGSSQNTDLWFIGFAKGKSEVTGVWLGNEDNSQLTTGTSADAAQLWKDYMSSVYR
jgi:penicillin-binding protein 1A